jgi:hypothetical protein
LEILQTFSSMSSRKFTLVCLCLASCLKGLMAADPAPAFTFSFGGYIHAEYFFDSRRMISAREGIVPMFPSKVVNDPDGNDLNAVSSTTFSLLSSRIQAGIAGPEIIGARSSALFEVDFLGTGPSTFNLVRIRHAFVRFHWEKTEMLAGQYWHPLFVAQCYPGVVAFGGGVPFHVLNRGPQLRLTHLAGKLSLAAMLVTQSDFASPGPTGTSTSYIRNSGKPEFFGQLIYQTPGFLAGGSAGYLFLRPRTVSESGYQTRETMGSFSGNFFARGELPGFQIKFQAIYGENLAHLVMPGGYGEAALIDPVRRIYDYTGIRTLSLWTDMETSTQPFRAGLFAGYARNLGSVKPITGESWARGSDIANLFRISPRIQMIYGRTSFSLELLYDVAAYGTPDESFRFAETEAADNLRVLAAIRYAF